MIFFFSLLIKRLLVSSIVRNEKRTITILPQYHFLFVVVDLEGEIK